MPGNLSSLNLVELVQTLKDQQQQYSQITDAIAQTLDDHRKQQRDASAAIASTLKQIAGLFSAVLGSTSSAPPPRPATQAQGSAKAVAKAPTAKPSGMRKGKRGRHSTTGPESVLAFIRAHGNPSTAELSQHWNGEGRGGKVENALAIMVK